MKQVVTLGESLIDFVAVETGVLNQVTQFTKAAGGAPANVAACIARLGGKAAFIGLRGADPFGDFLHHELQQLGVDTQYFLQTTQAKTALAFVSLDEHGERSFAFYRDPSADMLLEPEQIPVAFLAQAGILHVGSVSLSAQPVRSATLFAVRSAKQCGLLISYDPNWRPALWDNPDEGFEQLRKLAADADILKVNREELRLLTGVTDPVRGAAAFHQLGVTMVLITLDADGCYYSYRSHQDAGGVEEFSGRVAGLQVSVIDTTGAGDTFVGAFLWQASQAAGTAPLSIRAWRQPQVRAWVEFAVAASALVTTKKGAIPALPDYAQVLAFQPRT